MRLLIRLKALKNCSYDLKYYSKIRGFFYSLQKGSKYFNKHENIGYKFYSFSNIIPAKDMKEGDNRTLIISSPDKDFVLWLYGKISELINKMNSLNLGEMQFKIEKVNFLKPEIKHNQKLITGTPIILRIPKERYVEYGIKSMRPYEFWRPEHDFNAFVKQLSENLIKKYNQYYSTDIQNINLFEIFKFKKPVCVHRIEQGIERITVGSLWEFGFNHLENDQRRILQLGLDSGFGELNSSGFGFMNVVKNEKTSKNPALG